MNQDHGSPILPPWMIGEAGGLADRSHITLRIYGEDLDPNVVSTILRTNPTHAHRKGDRKVPTSGPAQQGAWLLKLEGRAPEGPDEMLNKLLDRLPRNIEAWQALREAGFDVYLGVGLFLGSWNQGFGLPSKTIARVAALDMDFDIYA